MSKIRIRMFGAFRNLLPDGDLQIEVSEKLTVEGLKTAIGERLTRIPCSYNVNALVSTSVLANEIRILENSEEIPQDTTLALLPPVSGG